MKPDNSNREARVKTAPLWFLWRIIIVKQSWKNDLIIVYEREDLFLQSWSTREERVMIFFPSWNTRESTRKEKVMMFFSSWNTREAFVKKKKSWFFHREAIVKERKRCFNNREAHREWMWRKNNECEAKFSTFVNRLLGECPYHDYEKSMYLVHIEQNDVLFSFGAIADGSWAIFCVMS